MELGFERSRAAFAQRRVVEACAQSREHQRAYRATTRSLGPAILVNGLGQALAARLRAEQLQKDEDKGERACLDDTANWVLDRFLREVLNATPTGTDGIALRNLVISPDDCDDATLLLVREETLRVLAWLKLFAEAEIAEDSDG